MNRTHKKATEWINDHLKKDQKFKGKCEAASNIEHCKKEIDTPSNLFNCNYCIKVFMAPKFLIKHILRRHPEKLLCLHNKILSLSKPETNLQEFNDLLNFLNLEFSNLKVELKAVKNALTEHIDELVRNQSIDLLQGKQCSHSVSALVGSKFLNEQNLNNTREEVTTVKNFSLTEFQRLQAKVEDLFQMHRENIKKIGSNEDKIYRKIKHDLLLEFQNMLLAHEQQNNTELQKCCFELRKELENVKKVCESNSKTIASSYDMEELEKKFNQQIQHFLNQGMFSETGKSTKGKVASTPSSNTHRLKRRHRSKFTCTTQSDYDKNISDVRFTTSDMKNSLKENELEVNQLKNISSENPEVDSAEAKFLVEEKLRSLNIPPDKEKLSSEEYEKKMRLINAEKEILSEKYKTFSKTYDKIGHYVNKIIKSQENKKLPKRLRFSDSPNILSEETDGNTSANMHSIGHKNISSFLPQPETSEEKTGLKYGNMTFSVENKDTSKEAVPNSASFLEHDGNLKPLSRRSLQKSDMGLQKSLQQNLETNSKFTVSNKNFQNYLSPSSKNHVNNLSDLSSLESFSLED